MKWAFNTALACLFLIPPMVKALDFTPTVETQMIDAYPIQYLSFADGDQRVEYGPPQSWKYTGNATQFLLKDPQNRQAEATFTVLPLQKVAPFSDEDRKNFQKFAKSFVPADSQNVTISETTGQHIIGNRQFYTASLSYAIYAQKLSLRVTFINLGKTCLQIVSQAPAGQFAAFSEALESSFCSWHWVPAR